jgi:hypothetical protein
MIQKAFLNLAILILNINHHCILNMEISAKRFCPLTKCYYPFKNTSQIRRQKLHIKGTNLEAVLSKTTSSRKNTGMQCGAYSQVRARTQFECEYII